MDGCSIVTSGARPSAESARRRSTGGMRSTPSMHQVRQYHQLAGMSFPGLSRTVVLAFALSAPLTLGGTGRLQRLGGIDDDRLANRRRLLHGLGSLDGAPDCLRGF